MPFFAGGGEMGERIRAFDWSSTPLGPAQQWPQGLKTACRIMLASQQPIWIGWGEDLTYLYNDAYKAIIGGKHPHMLGQPTSIVWEELWEDIGPVLARTMSGEGVYVESQLLIMERHGFPEETYYTYSFSPIPDDTGSTSGVFCANTDDTARVIGQRQLDLLRELGVRSVDSRSWQEAAHRAADALGTNRRDVPFALIYLSEPGTRRFELASTSGLSKDQVTGPAAVFGDKSAPWSLEDVLRSRELVVIDDLAERGVRGLPTGDWEVVPDRVALVPIPALGDTGRGGVLVAGLSPYRIPDEGYRNFLTLVAGQISAAIASSQAYEEERMRAEALAEIDRAKTQFFSNVSHEFRTPLTLMLGPVEDLLRQDRPDLSEDARTQLSLIQRNGLRMLKLVNALLDFSRIEAGRVRASYTEVNLARFTAELASNFESVSKRAGVDLRIDCSPRPETLPAAYVDQDMWEKIVLNLISNAFKFTVEGEITITLRYDADPAGADESLRGSAVLTVMDTGIGIPAEHLQHVFERFHRVEDATDRGRTFEGTGIGLALVHELVRLHGGTVHVESEVGRGSRFIVRIPLGTSHLDARHVEHDRRTVEGREVDGSFVEEVATWVSDDAGDATPRDHDGVGTSSAGVADAPGATRDRDDRPSILLADDNADMREYVGRILSARFDVVAVANGEAALETIRKRTGGFDLVLSDVMMPRLDGFGLLRALRADPVLGTIPIVLLSARAGEEAEIESMEAGADDYVIKPFSARELLARVDAHIRMARYRREAERRVRGTEERYRSLVSVITDVPYVTDPRGAYVEPQPHWQAYTGQTWEEHKEFGWIDAVHPEDRDRLLEAWARARDARELHEFSGRLWHASSAEYRHFTVKATPFVDSDGVVRGWVGACTDVHEAVRSAEALREADRRKDEFLATLAHELRNPLAPIRNSLHVLRLAGSDASKMERVHEMMDRQVKHMVRLVDDLMEVSRITRGKIELRKERVELATIVRSSVETSKPLIDAGGHSLDIDVPSGPITLDADPIRIAQVLANLLNNAAKYTPRGGQIELKAEKRGAFIHVSVRDNGIGIPSEHLPEVFELFTQVDRSSGHSKGGLGIGLTLARSLVELHGGSVTASSDGAGYGSEFTVTIPIAEEVSAVASASSRIVSERRLPRRRILVVDDNRDAADSLAMLLEHLAAEVRVANDGSAALDAIRTFQPSVILLDIDMPKMNGYEVARRARSESSGRGAVIVALTGWGQEEDRRRSVDAGIDHHLVKPVDLDVLRDLLAGIPAED